MGCNCGKKAAATVRANQAAPKPPRPTNIVPAPSGKPLKGVTQSFALEDGRVFGSKLERDAARVRSTHR